VNGFFAMPKAELYDRYPIVNVAVYNSSTIAHFLLGGWILFFSTKIIGSIGIIISTAYVVLSFLEMYVIMPLKVCPKCVYFRLPGSRCISGLNRWAMIIAKPGNPSDFPNRAKGPFCQNNLYMASLLLPIILGGIILAIKFSLALLLTEIGLVLLLAFRFFIVFPFLACVHCRGKFLCPQAGQMGVRGK
jgi:hypothetical protein